MWAALFFAGGVLMAAGFFLRERRLGGLLKNLGAVLVALGLLYGALVFLVLGAID